MSESDLLLMNSLQLNNLSMNHLPHEMVYSYVYQKARQHKQNQVNSKVKLLVEQAKKKSPFCAFIFFLNLLAPTMDKCSGFIGLSVFLYLSLKQMCFTLTPYLTPCPTHEVSFKLLCSSDQNTHQVHFGWTFVDVVAGNR